MSLLCSVGRDRYIHVWDVPSGEVVQQFERRPSPSPPRSHCVSSDGSLIASATISNAIHIWHVATGALLHELEGHTGVIIVVTFSKRSLPLLGSAGHDAVVRIWNVSSIEGGEREEDFLPPKKDKKDSKGKISTNSNSGTSVNSNTSAATIISSGTNSPRRLSRKGSSLNNSNNGSSGSNYVSGGLMRLNGDRHDLRQRFELRGHDGCVHSLEFNNRGDVIASGGEDRTVRLWNMENGQQMHILSGHTQAVHIVHFSPEDDLVATCSLDKTNRLYDTRTGMQKTQIHSLSSTHAKAMIFTLTGNGIILAGGDYVIRLYSIERTSTKLQGQSAQLYGSDRTCTVRTEFKGHHNTVCVLALGGEGKLLASGGADAAVRVWRVGGGTLLHLLQKHKSPISALAFSPSSDFLASGAQGGDIAVWDTGNGTPLQILNGHSGGVLSLLFLPDMAGLAELGCGSTLIGGDGESNIADGGHERRNNVMSGKEAAAILVRELRKPPLHRSVGGAKLVADCLGKVDFLSKFDWNVRYLLSQRCHVLSLEKNDVLFDVRPGKDRLDHRMYLIITGSLTVLLRRGGEEAFRSQFRPTPAPPRRIEGEVSTATSNQTMGGGAVLWQGKWIDRHTVGLNAVALSRCDLLSLSYRSITECLTRFRLENELEKINSLELSNVEHLGSICPLFSSPASIPLLQRLAKAPTLTVFDLPPQHVVYRMGQRGPQGIFIVLRGSVSLRLPQSHLPHPPSPPPDGTTNSSSAAGKKTAKPRLSKRGSWSGGTTVWASVRGGLGALSKRGGAEEDFVGEGTTTTTTAASNTNNGNAAKITTNGADDGAVGGASEGVEGDIMVDVGSFSVGGVFGGVSRTSDGVFEGFSHSAKTNQATQLLFLSATDLLWFCPAALYQNVVGVFSFLDDLMRGGGNVEDVKETGFRPSPVLLVTKKKKKKETLQQTTASTQSSGSNSTRALEDEGKVEEEEEKEVLGRSENKTGNGDGLDHIFIRVTEPTEVRRRREMNMKAGSRARWIRNSSTHFQGQQSISDVQQGLQTARGRLEGNGVEKKKNSKKNKERRLQGENNPPLLLPTSVPSIVSKRRAPPLLSSSITFLPTYPLSQSAAKNIEERSDGDDDDQVDTEESDHSGDDDSNDYNNNNPHQFRSDTPDSLIDALITTPPHPPFIVNKDNKNHAVGRGRGWMGSKAAQLAMHSPRKRRILLSSLVNDRQKSLGAQISRAPEEKEEVSFSNKLSLLVRAKLKIRDARGRIQQQQQQQQQQQRTRRFSNNSDSQEDDIKSP